MNRSIELVAGQRHADLLAEAARQRLVGGTRQGSGGTEPATRDRSWRLLLPWRALPAR
jgi:hypothetical protein